MMFYQYDETLLRKTIKKSSNLFVHLLSIILLTVAIISAINGNIEMTIGFSIFIVLNYAITALSKYKASLYPTLKLSEYKQRINLLKASGTPIGAELTEEYIIIRALVFTIQARNEEHVKNCFVERKIYYTDIKRAFTQSGNYFIDFYDHYNPAIDYERLCLNSFFINSDDMLNEIQKRL